MGIVISTWAALLSHIFFNIKKFCVGRIRQNNTSKLKVNIGVFWIHFLLFSDIWSIDLHGFDGVLSAFAKIALGVVSK